MRLDDLEPDHVQRAISVFCQHAWPPEGERTGQGTKAEPSKAAGPRVDLEPLMAATTRADVLALFERGDPGDDPSSRRYTLRLGNYRYPFMKFVLQEHLVAEEFFFSVDTHDKLDIDSDSPDYAEWEALKTFNRMLASRIERAWDDVGLPTHTLLLALLAELAKVERAEARVHRLLLVDDDEHVSAGLGALLRARGYEVEMVHDGARALERLGADPVPDLVLLDFEMPELNGGEVLRRMRADERLATVPVLMATASKIDLAQLEEVSGLLHKPYPRHVLFEMLERLLDRPG